MTVNELLQIPYITELIMLSIVVLFLVMIAFMAFFPMIYSLLDYSVQLLRFKYVHEKEWFDKEYPDKKGFLEKLVLKIKNRKRK